jgi:translation elongation factor EF-1alpha
MNIEGYSRRQEQVGRWKVNKTEEKPLGRVTHYYSHLGVSIIELTVGELNVGDIVHIKGKHTDFTQTVDSIQIEHQNISHAEKGKSVGIKVKEKVREHDQVFRVSE